MHPELSFKEFRTTERLKEILRSLDIEIIDIGMETGVVALLRGAADGPTVALRGDIDGLPVQEETGVPYESKNLGVMHACGHDMHTTCVVGAAMMLAEVRDKMKGNVKFIFQPGEEVNEGARLLVEKGVMDDVDAVFGLHVHPDVPVGKIGVKLGGLMAAVDTIRISVHGEGGHGAIPNKTVDPVVATSAIIMNLQSIASRNISPLEPVVVSIGTLQAGIANNVIPDVVRLTGTVRSFSAEVRQQVPELMKRILDSTAAAYGARTELEYIFHLPAVFNKAEMHGLAVSSVEKIDSEAVVDPVPSMGGEDFALFMEKAPGFFYWLGVGNPEKNCVYQWHNPKFNSDEDSLPLGSAVLAQSALDALEKLSGGKLV